MKDEKTSDTSGREIEAHFRRNFLTLAFSLVTQRIGWIFKTESVVMPGFVNTFTGSGAIRGLLPLISRFCRSFPQLVAANSVNRIRHKKAALFAASLMMALAWAFLAGVVFFFPDFSPRPMLITFFFAYTIMWIGYGVGLLFRGVLQGKLIPVNRRGRLLAVSNSTGCFLAVIAVYFLMARLIASGYGAVFGITSAFFLISAFSILILKEPPDPVEKEKESFVSFIAGSASIISRDKNFRWLVCVMTLAYGADILFPHYTIFGMESLGLERQNFVPLMMAQNTVNGLSSLAMGRLADRRGNRIVMGTLIAFTGFIPLLAIGIAALPAHLGKQLYWLVFGCIGFIPVLQQVIVNYVLEICPREKHGQYLGTMNAIWILPTMASPLVGLAIDHFSFRPVFVASSIAIFCGAALTLKLKEPRNGGLSDVQS